MSRPPAARNEARPRDTTRRQDNRGRLFIVALVISAVMLNSCGRSHEPSASVPAQSPKPTTSVASSTSPVRVAHNTLLGTILVDSKGFSLYTLTNGSKRPATCRFASCSRVWPLVRVPSDRGAFIKQAGVTGLGKSRSGTLVTYMGFPIHQYLGDASPGETNGNGVRTSGGTWYVLEPDRVPGPGP